MAEIKNLKKAAKRILSAVKKGENIILYGDADLDGTTSVLILEETIKNLGGRAHGPTIYFPDRESEGYGLNERALEFLSKAAPRRAPALLILLDCGIGNFEEIELAKKLGFETIVIDHHDILKNRGAPQCTPVAAIVVDPKQKSDKYPFKQLATVSIIFLLAELLLGDNLSPNLEQSFMELGALGTIADMMPEEDINKIIIEKGLSSIFFSFRPGLRILLEVAGGGEDSPRKAVQKLVSILNITGIKNHLTEGYLLLSAPEEGEVKILAQRLLWESEQRSAEIYEITKEVLERIGRADRALNTLSAREESLGQRTDKGTLRLTPQGESKALVFEGSPDWPQALTGSVASRICNKYKNPTFIFKMGSKLSRGSVRVPKGVNSVQALEKCSHLLEMYGGHPPAAGFTVKNENIDKLKQCLVEYFEKL